MGRAFQAVRPGWPRNQVLRNQKCKTNPPNIGLKFVGRISIKDERRKAAGRVGGSSKSQLQVLLNLALKLFVFCVWRARLFEGRTKMCNCRANYKDVALALRPRDRGIAVDELEFARIQATCAGLEILEDAGPRARLLTCRPAVPAAY